MIVTDGEGLPMGLTMDSASVSEFDLIEATLEDIAIAKSNSPGRPRKRPERVIADKGYDSNKVRKSLTDKGIAPVIPARSNNKRATHQDGRPMRRYRKRWKVERTIAWLQNCRRLVVRWERKASLWLSFAYIACAMLVLNRVLK